MVADKVIIILGSGKDEEYSIRIGEALNEFTVPYEVRVASAHKTPHKLLHMLDDYEASGDRIVYITVAGRSNALSGFVDANTKRPVIACPPYSDKFGGADLYSSLRMPSGVGPLIVLEPESAALAATKILAIANDRLKSVIDQHLQRLKQRVIAADDRLRGT
jgi:5-(carboxyamino)imidazole ribonucleotide mutase